MNDATGREVTDRHTDTQTDYCNPPAHARRGLIMLKHKSGAYEQVEGV